MGCKQNVPPLSLSQLIESGAQKDLLREENKALSQRLAALQEQLNKSSDEQLKAQLEETNMKLMQTMKEVCEAVVISLDFCPIQQ